MGIGHCFVCLLGERNHGSLYGFTAFAAIRSDKFAVFDVRHCHVRAVRTRLDPALEFFQGLYD